MRRIRTAPRPGWRERVESQGLVYPMTPARNGLGEQEYWFERAAYVLGPDEVDHLEGVTERAHEMCVEAARYLCSGALGDLGLPPGALEAARASLAAAPPSLYGRFDLRFDGRDGQPAKVLEYNADTPTGLVEASVAQWYWLQDVAPELDQWNSLHERLVEGWRGIRERTGLGLLHLAHLGAEKSGEEEMTVGYLRDCADQAGWSTRQLQVEQLGWNPDVQRFVGTDDDVIDVLFKLYPWEDVLWEDFGAHALTTLEQGSTLWVEPLWKAVLSNKALLVALWRCFPGHENLLPASMDAPGGMTEWVKKPLHGREGDNIEVSSRDLSLVQPGGYGAEGFVYQQYVRMPDFDGNRAVVGSWVVDGRAAGCGIRESDSPVTDYYARFVPHHIDGPAPSPAQRADWLSE